MPIRSGLGLRFPYDYGGLISVASATMQNDGAARERIELVVNPQGGVMNKMFVIAALSCAICWGQHPENCKPSALNIPEAKYPCIFPRQPRDVPRHCAGCAKGACRLGGGLELTKGPDGIWSGTTPQPWWWASTTTIVRIDGATVADPSTMTFFGSGWQNSGIEIPAPDAGFLQPKDVPRGRVSEQWYYSKVTGEVAPLLRLYAA